MTSQHIVALVYRLQFAPGDTTLGAEAKSDLGVLSVLLYERRGLAVVTDGYRSAMFMGW